MHVRKEKPTKSFRTASGAVSEHGREAAEEKGQTMPGGRFPIRNKEDLANAKHSIGRAKGDKGAVKAWINKRARELGAAPVGGSKRSRMYDHPRSRSQSDG